MDKIAELNREIKDLKEALLIKESLNKGLQNECKVYLKMNALLRRLLRRSYIWCISVPTDEQLDVQVPALDYITGRDLLQEVADQV